MMAETKGYDGVLNMYKPRGWSSYKVVEEVKWRVPVEKVGHAGTLDPNATGVLPVCLGRATKIVPYLLEATKTYVATMRLGVVTDTQDSEGKVIQEACSVMVRDDQLEAALAQFRGPGAQVPPMYSALRHRGERLYSLARKGLTVDREPREIRVYDLRLLGRDDRDVTFRITCSSGTYVRTLCHDIGRALGCGAHLRLLERVRVGPFSIETAVLPERLNAAGADGLRGILTPINEALAFLPTVELRGECVRKVLHGMPVAKGFLCNLSGQIAKGSLVRVSNAEGRLIAVAEALTGPDEQAAALSETILFRLRRVLAA